LKTLLIDTSYLLYKASFSFAGLHDKDGEGSGVIFGFLKDVKTLAHKFKTNKFIFLCDSQQSKRASVYPEYKNPRKKKRKDLSEEEKRRMKDNFRQFDVVRDSVLPKIGFRNIFLQEGYEGDDFFGAILKQKKSKRSYIMVTSDEDMFQLLDYAPFYNSNRKIPYTAKAFRKEKRIRPLEWSEVKAVGGCRSDNVIGIPGVGESKAISYILHEMNMRTKTYEKIINGSKIIKRNRKLVTLPYKGTMIPKFKRDKLTIDGLRTVCKKYSMYSFIEGKTFREWQNILNGKF